MPLTRHLYELDEVVSALQTCLRNGWPRSPFWIWELVRSSEEALALRELRSIWLRLGGGHDPACMTVTPTTSDDWVRLTLRIESAIRAAGSLTAEALLTAAAAQPSRRFATPRPANQAAAARRRNRSAAFVASLDPAEEIDRDEAANWWISLDAACRQGVRRDAIWLLQASLPLVSPVAIWSALQIAARSGAGPAIAAIQAAVAADAHPVTQALAQANAILLLCERGVEARDSFLAPVQPPVGFTLRSWAEWDSKVGRRAARIHPIPRDALHAGTTRGSMPKKYTNIEDLRDPVVLLPEGCAYWRATCEAAGITEDAETGGVIFPDDDVLEAFVDKHFPDDVPDEWSRADQEKSHGRGCAEEAPAGSQSVVLREEALGRLTWRLAISVRWTPLRLR
jgi:hypothetical protein